MPSISFKIKVKHGAAEFEAEGTQKFVEAKLKEFRPLLNMPEARQSRKTAGPKRKIEKLFKASYPEKAIKPLKEFMKKAKPKTQVESLLAIAKHHMQHFNADKFTNKDLSSAASAIGKKLGNISAILKTALKSKKIKKLEKGTWQLLAGKPIAMKADKPAERKKPGSPKKSAKAKPRRKALAVKPETTKPEPTPPKA